MKIKLLFLALAAGIAVGLYFALRKKTPGPTGPGGPSGPSGPAPGVTGTNNPPPVGGVTGNFSIQSVHDPTRYITFKTGDANSITSAGSIGDFIATPGGTGPCANFSWKNVGNVQFSPLPNDTVASALVSNATRVGTTPPPFVATLINVIGFSTPPFDVVIGTATTGNNPTTIQNYNWIYNATNKTWCGPGSLANNCLYLESNNTVKARTFNPSDTRFQWDNVAPITTCL